MSSSTACSQCLRLIRRSARWEQTVNEFTPKHLAMYRPQARAVTQAHRSMTVNARQFSTSSIRCQESQPIPDPKPYTTPPPVTTGTVTSNVTAAPPESTPDTRTAPASTSTSKPKAPAPSTAEMQKQITSSLSQTRGSNFTMNIAQKLRQTAKSTTESYITYGLTEAFFKSCSAQADYTIPEDQRNRILTDKGPPKTAEGEDLGLPESDSWWFKDLELQPTFSTWSQVSYLHMYLLTVRLRAMESNSEFLNYQRYLIEHFSHAAEDKMLILHNLGARGIRNKYLKDLFIQWRGVLAAYDEGMTKGDAVLAAAVWRNLWKGREDVDWEKVAAVVAYMRKVTNRLANIELDELVHNLDQGMTVWSTASHDLKSSINQNSRSIEE